MLLYRLIPDQWGYLLKYNTNKDGLTTEDLFYDLGYLNVSEHAIYLPITTDPILMPRTWHNNTGKGVFFFTSPWDCVKNFRWIDSWNTSFENFGVRICEYDIPDEIIANSWHGEGYYRGIACPEVKVPLEFLFSNPETNVTPELAASLKTVAESQAEESCSNLVPVVKEMLQRESQEVIESKLKIIKTKLFAPESQAQVNELRFQNSGIFQKSPFITGRRFYITITDYYHACHQNGFDYESLIPLSNGILTEENIAEYRKRFQNR